MPTLLGTRQDGPLRTRLVVPRCEQHRPERRGGGRAAPGGGARLQDATKLVPVPAPATDGAPLGESIEKVVFVGAGKMSEAMIMGR